MKIDDTLLRMMIEREMHEKGVSHYLLFDDVLVNPSEIEVGANEACYLVGVSVKTQRDFEVVARSGTSSILYNNQTCEEVNGCFKSSQISSHWGTIKLDVDSVDAEMLMRVVRVSFIN